MFTSIIDIEYNMSEARTPAPCIIQPMLRGGNPEWATGTPGTSTASGGMARIMTITNILIRIRLLA
jgi:hypothetical protein